jgi:hypothetical protein
MVQHSVWCPVLVVGIKGLRNSLITYRTTHCIHSLIRTLQHTVVHLCASTCEAVQAPMSYSSPTHTDFIITSCLKTIGPKDAGWSVTICLLSESTCSQGMESTSITMRPSVGIAEHDPRKQYLRNTSGQKITHLPPFDKISISGHIPLHSTQIAAQLRSPAFFHVVSKQRFTELFEL